MKNIWIHKSASHRWKSYWKPTCLNPFSLDKDNVFGPQKKEKRIYRWLWFGFRMKAIYRFIQILSFTLTGMLIVLTFIGVAMKWDVAPHFKAWHALIVYIILTGFFWSLNQDLKDIQEFIDKHDDNGK